MELEARGIRKILKLCRSYGTIVGHGTQSARNGTSKQPGSRQSEYFIFTWEFEAFSRFEIKNAFLYTAFSA
jgi:hypothetical protein